MAWVEKFRHSRNATHTEVYTHARTPRQARTHKQRQHNVDDSRSRRRQPTTTLMTTAMRSLRNQTRVGLVHCLPPRLRFSLKHTHNLHMVYIMCICVWRVCVRVCVCTYAHISPNSRPDKRTPNVVQPNNAHPPHTQIYAKI